MPNLVVAHLLAGGVVKGTSLDVDPGKPLCHVRTESGVVKVKLAEAKALFFVRDLSGNPARVDSQAIAPEDPRRRGAAVVEVRFRDGERVIAFTNRYPPRGQFYFVVPVDQGGNNTRILVNQAAVAALERLPDLPG
jgi:hypothetical protein